MEDKDYVNSYVIPANYTDSGKWLGGMVSPRNAIEAIIIVLGLGYLEYIFFSGQDIVRVILMVVTLLPIGIIAIMGIDGDSLVQFTSQVIRFIKSKRKMHFQKIGGEYAKKGKD